MTSVHNSLTGKSEEQASEIERLSAELERERRNAEQGRMEIAQLRNKTESLNDMPSEMKTTVERLSRANEEETKARIAAFLQAKLDAALVRVEEGSSSA
jgi:FtsZ-binding cell division protein ZapB